MATLNVGSGSMAGIDVDGRRFRAHNGKVTVPDHLVSHLKREAECFDVAAPVRAPGFVCEDCSFVAVFRTCGRCGGTCHRPGGKS